MKQIADFFKKINKIDKPLARLNKGKKKTQITNIGNETVYITIGPAPIQRIRDYQEKTTFIHLTSEMKWTNSSKYINYHNSLNRK